MSLRCAFLRFVAVGLGAFGLGASPAGATSIITFDTLIQGQTAFAFGDVLFTTTDPFGFNTFGPGLDQVFIQEPGLEGTAELAEDLRVDFAVGATGSIRFGFALSADFEGADVQATFSLFDATDTLIATTTVPGLFSPSSFPEGQIDLPFAGVASYGLFDFEAGDSGFGRYIIDDFEGDFGVIPEPGTALLVGLGLTGLGLRRRAVR